MSQRKTRKRAAGTTAESVLGWIQEHVETNGLRPGDPLPKELDIARAAGAGRSSVREALTALKALGIVTSRKKGGIRIVRDPVLLGLREYLTERYDSKARFADAMEFRAALEWGLGELVYENISPRELAELRRLVESVRNGPDEPEVMYRSEKRFHTLMTAASHNDLARLLTYLYTPVFDTAALLDTKPYTAADWVRDHGVLVEALENRDRALFLKTLDHHNRSYLRLGRKPGRGA